MRFFYGFITAILVIIIAVVVVVWAGLFNIAATQHSATVERFLGFAATQSIARLAEARTNPYREEPQVLSAGLQHYADTCLMCHGAPGVDPNEFAHGLSPQPPEMTSSDVQAYTDGELLWIITHGIMASGMPAFGPTHSEEDIWKIITFVRHMPHLSTEEQERLLTAQGNSQYTRAGQEHAGHTH